MPRRAKNPIRLNDRTIEGLNPRERTEYHDRGAPGLRLIVYEDGSKAWTCRPLVSPGRQRRFTLGHWCYRGGMRDKDCMTTTEARERFLLVLAEARRGKLAHAKRLPKAETSDSLKAVADRYFEHHQRLIDSRNPSRKRARTMREERRRVEKDVLPATSAGHLVAEIPVQEIQPSHLMDVLRRISDRGSMVQRERVRGTLSNILRFAMIEGLIEINPVTAVPRLTKEVPRSRRFSEAEVAKLWRLWTGADPASQGLNLIPEMSHFFCLSLLTLTRRIELLYMEWEQIKQGDRGWSWMIPAELKMPDNSRFELVKNGVDHRVPLSSVAVRILKEKVRPITGESRWVWRSLHREGLPWCPSIVQRAKMKFQKAAELEDFRLHDLRSIGATLMAQLKVPEPIISSACNHKPKSITARVYIRQQERFFDERAEALEKLALHVEQIAANAQVSTSPI